MDVLPYNPKSKESIAEYAQKLVGKSFRQILDEDPHLSNSDKTCLFEYFSNIHSKGSLGNLIEKHYFFYEPNSNPEADFNEAGVELKVTPYIINKNKTLSAKERLVLTMIDYMEDYKHDFESSHVYSKCAIMLLIHYLYEATLERLDYRIKYSTLFELPENDLEIIKKDYQTIIEKIKAGKAHEISEGDTNYLGACTKGANSDSVREQPFNKNVVAKQRAFCLKQSYMSYILNNYIAKLHSETDSVIKDSSILKEKTLEEFVIEKLSSYYGLDIEYLKATLKIPYSLSDKGFTFYLAKAMLNVIGDRIEEFEKANIKIKAIRLNKKRNAKRVNVISNI